LNSAILKATDFQINELQNKINNIPRKSYENFIFVMNKLIFNSKVAFWIEYSFL
jgi:hypothetical protein